MKHKKNKISKVSLKWKIFAYMLIFVALLLVILWLLQTVYLDTFYRHIKLKEVKKCMNAVENLVKCNESDEDLKTAVSEIADNYNMSILLGDSSGNLIASAENKDNPKFDFVHHNSIIKLFELADKGKDTVKINKEDILDQVHQGGFTDDKKPREIDDSSPYNAKIVTGANGEKYVLVVHCTLTPVNATVDTLKVQLVYISIILVALSLGLALIISKTISKSIVKVSESAKELAEGRYDVEFDGRDYKEIAELSDTLNYTAVQLGKSELLQRELIANVSHDLRTPLTMITAYSEVMRDIPGENTPENVQVIIDEAKRLTILVNDLMDISKIQAGVTVLETKEYDLTESIKTTVDRYAKLLEPYGYNLTFEYDEHVIVDADEFKIYQVIYNLIGNAVNYTGDDRTIRVVQHTFVDKVKIEVTDTGVGIPKEELDSVWERFYKIDKTHKRAVVGTGLGLSIVKNILKLHHAEFGVESEIGKGSTFWFELKKINTENMKEEISCQ